VIITQTPLRVSLIGGGTDIKGYYLRNGGEVLSFAIDKYVYVVLKKRFDEKIRVGYSKTELVDRLDDLRHELIREAMRICGVESGVEIATLSDAPAGGSGLGTSSSITVGALNAFYHYRFNPQPPERLASDAVRIEVDTLKKPIGKQDQYIAAYGGLCRITFHTDETVSVERVRISEEAKRNLERHLVLFYTGIERSANPILKDLSDNMSSKEALLDGIKSLVPAMFDAISAGDMKEVGRILDENWRLKREYADGVTNSDLDSMYRSALAAGAYGGKISGAGGGGFFLICCPPERIEDIWKALGQPKLLPIRIEQDGSKVILNIRR